MGWLKLGPRTPVETLNLSNTSSISKHTTEHIEDISSPVKAQHDYEFQPLSLPNSELPFIPAEKVRQRKSAVDGGLFIVVDNIVYDCTAFISEHPGGEQVIRSFAGAECSWQFWRFHGKHDMEEFGKPLRVGRTAGLENKFKEPVKYVGLRRLDDDWD